MTALLGGVEALVADARSRITRLDPPAALAAVLAGARIVDHRPAWQRAQYGEVPGAIVVERNHLEWRLHPASSHRLPHAAGGVRWIVMCNEGYASSLATAALVSIGVDASDLAGGFLAWRDAGLPVTPAGSAPTGVERIVPGAARLLANAI